MPKSNATQKRRGSGRQHLNHTVANADANMSESSATDTMKLENGRDELSEAFLSNLRKTTSGEIDTETILYDKESRKQFRREGRRMIRNSRNLKKGFGIDSSGEKEDRVRKRAKTKKMQEEERRKGRREKKMGRRHHQVIEEVVEDDIVVPQAQVMTMELRPKAPIQQQPLPQPQVSQAGTFNMALRPKNAARN